MTSPITPSSKKRLGIEEAYRKLGLLFDELGVRYYDFNLCLQEVLETKDTDLSIKKDIWEANLLIDIQLY